MTRGNVIVPADFPAELRNLPNGGPSLAGHDSAPQVGSTVSLEKLEEAHLRKVLEKSSSLSEAAEILGIDQATLYRKRKKIGLE
jgi:NtrC-family two-component system response regulator AlgB